MSNKKIAPKKISKPLPKIPIRTVEDINYVNVEYLLSTTDFDINKIAPYKNGTKEENLTFLFAAIYNRDVQLVDYLLENNADVNIKPNPLSPSLGHFAIEIDDADLLRKLIAHNIDLEESSMPGKQTILFNAAYSGKFEMVKILIEGGANVNHKDIHNTTPLIISTTFEITKILLDNGAEVNAMSEFCGSALMRAVRINDLDRAKLLLAYGAEINCTKINNSGTEPLIHFMTHWIHTDPFKFFMRFNDEFHVNKLNDKNKTALHLLVTRPISSCDNGKWLPLIREFLNAGMDVNQEDNEGKLAIECSTGRNYMCISEIRRHIVKLISIGCFYVCPRNSAAVEDQRYDKLRIECEEELKIITTTRLNSSSVTFYDVLEDSVDNLVVGLKEVDVVDIMDAGLNLIFPNYGDMIYYKLLKVSHKMK